MTPLPSCRRVKIALSVLLNLGLVSFSYDKDRVHTEFNELHGYSCADSAQN